MAGQTGGMTIRELEQRRREEFFKKWVWEGVRHVRRNEKPNIKPGDMVTWTSQSGGVSRTKTGRVVAIIPKKAAMADYYPEIANVLRSRIKAQQINWIHDRALVQVSRESYFDYYAPPLGILRVVE